MTVTYLPDDLYRQIELSMPIACVDFVPLSRTPPGIREVGLILRDSPHGRVWCHLGGRIHRGETIARALTRHALETLGTTLRLPLNPQPEFVYEWFPRSLAPADGTVFGDDPRKHAIGLSFALEMDGTPDPRGEAIDFAFADPLRLPAPLWPGSETLIDRLVSSWGA